MNPTQERKLALVLLSIVLVINGVALSAELSMGAVNGSDNVSHWALLQGMVHAVETGGNPLDFWSGEGSFGAPTMRTYQSLAHALVALLYFALGKTVPLMTVFLWVRYLAIVLLPLAFFIAAEMLELPPMTALAGAALAPLISTNALYGLDYSSYVSTGRGLFPQSVAAILLLLAIGYGYRAVRYGRTWVMAGLFTGLTCICHFIYGWMAAVTICLMALLPDPLSGRIVRVRRAAAVGLVALVVSAFQILPVLTDGPILNHSRWEGQWKWDSFGAATVMKYLVTGELLDHGRPPVLTLLALAGAAWILWNFYRSRRMQPSHALVLSGALLWLLVFFGRATWGPLLLVLGATRDLHLHRTIGAVQVFLVLLAAIGLTAVISRLSQRLHVAAALVVAVAAFAPMLYERSRYLAGNESGGYQLAAAYAADQGLAERVIADVRQRGGRVYAGLGTAWGARFVVGPVPFFALLNMGLVPQTSAPYNMLALTADLIPQFDETRPAHYRLYDIRSVVAPREVAGGLPKFLTPVESVGRVHILDAPGGGYFDVVDVAAQSPANKENFYDLNSRWLQSDWPERKAYVRLNFRGGAPADVPRLPEAGPLPQAAPAPASSAGTIASERQDGEVYRAELEIARPSFALFKMTWHPNWVSYVDGKAASTAMLSPGFIGVPMAVGRHALLLQYEPGTWKLWMALGGLLAAVALAFAERRGYLVRVVPASVVEAPAPAPQAPPVAAAKTARRLTPRH
jgi:hypothetical protein